jgi:uncharacterized membrane protein YraQ (UPF0718 family)
VWFGAALLWMIVLGLTIWTARKPERLHLAAAGIAVNQFIRILPRLALALLTAGFLGQLLPGELIGSLIGAESGAKGILIASVAGGFTPGGPIISFPIVVVLREAGAGVPQLVAFLTAWSVFAIHRVLIYESTIMGWRFSGMRLFASLTLPPIAGFAAELIGWMLGSPAALN